jgi:dihydroneopterin aldolase
MDIIILEGIRCQVHIGVPRQERAARQLILIDLEVAFDFSDAAASDDFRQTIDYEKLVEAVRETAETRKYSLVETLAQQTCQRILDEFPVQSAKVRLRKYPVTLKNQVESVGVLTSRRKNSE